MVKTKLFFVLFILSLTVRGQSIEISYLTGLSTSLFAQNLNANKNPLRLKNSFYPFPNYVGEACVSYNFLQEKYKITLAYNQLNYSYGIRTSFHYANEMTLPYNSHIYNHAISISFGPNIQIKPKIIFHPYFSVYTSFKNSDFGGSAAQAITVNSDNGTSNSYLLLVDRVTFKPTVLLGIGYKFNFFVNKWLFFTVGSRYVRGFYKSFNITLKSEIDGTVYETHKAMRSSNFSIDLGLGAKFNLKKK